MCYHVASMVSNVFTWLNYKTLLLTVEETEAQNLTWPVFLTTSCMCVKIFKLELQNI